MEDLARKFNDSLREDFEKLRSIHYNPNVKGKGYEDILREFLVTYLGDVFKFNSRVALIDTNHDIFHLLKPSQNEFDVVAQFKTAFPSKVYVYNEIQFVSYDSCAFVVEVAQTLTKEQLLEDLDKLSKLSILNEKMGWLNKGKRFGITVGGPYNVGYPLRILFYYDVSVSTEAFISAIEKEIASWDLLIILKEDHLLINANLPTVVKKPPRPFLSIKGNAMLLLFHVLGESLPYPLVVNAFGPFRKLLFPKQEKEKEN